MTICRTHEFSIPLTHPTAALHFPELPIVPGAMLLDEAIAVIGAATPLRLQAVKFLSPVRHGEAIVLSWQDGGGGIAFQIHRQGESAPLLTGTLA
ncbi:MAG: hypothetical protein KGQ69_06305 [Rhodospirillales bacterium]|nr:hypothetical protein [Rhodospirillales bacterium]MDE2240739.1 hypothetical protein [Rhodospirillales bacterium]